MNENTQVIYDSLSGIASDVVWIVVALAVLACVLAGGILALSLGNSQQEERGTAAIKAAVKGVFVAFLASAIILLVQGNLPTAG